MSSHRRRRFPAPRRQPSRHRQLHRPFVRGVAMCLVALLPFLGACAGGVSTITVRASERLQVMQGWEALIGGTPECNQRAWNGVRERVLDLAAFDLGLNRVRLPLRSGYEDSTDYFVRYMRGEMTFDQWKSTWFRPVNDDQDPRHVRVGGFQWSYLDHVVETQVLPLKRRLQERGDDLWINVEYIGGANTPHGADPEEYAELVVATFERLRDRFGLVPQSLEVINEPNMHNAWTPQQVARALVAAKARLAAAGFAPQVIAPSTTTMQHALQYLDGMLAVPGAREALTDFSYHRYGGNAEVLGRIARRADSLGYRTAMLEKIGADQDTLFQDLTVGRVSAWQQFGLVHCAPPGRGDGGGIYIRFAQEDTLHPTARLTPTARYLRQYFRYVPLGAHRVAASSDDRQLRATAYVTPTGRQVVVVNADAARSLAVRGLAPGRYGITWTTAESSSAAPEEHVLAAGGVLKASLHGPGVLTVFGQ